MDTEFKVGDRVRVRDGQGYGLFLASGQTGIVSDVRGEFVELDDNGNGHLASRFELIDTTHELAELRAFKETALASGYVPPEPVDPDLLVARRIAADDAQTAGYTNRTYEEIMAGQKDDDRAFAVLLA